ncbi:MAG: serine kinase [Bacteroides sp.]|jgi:predicted transcriptional regulator|nr:serine kinase [Bacteroides sp.]
MMTISDIAQKLSLKVLSGQGGINREVTGGYVSDLLSDVMGHAQAGHIWITLQTHKNVMAIASLKDLAAVILVSSHQPNEDTAMQSNEEEIPVLGTDLSAFEISGKLYEILKT